MPKILVILGVTKNGVQRKGIADVGVFEFRLLELVLGFILLLMITTNVWLYSSSLN
jgi:hypothetical protein